MCSSECGLIGLCSFISVPDPSMIHPLLNLDISASIKIAGQVVEGSISKKLRFCSEVIAWDWRPIEGWRTLPCQRLTTLKPANLERYIKRGPASFRQVEGSTSIRPPHRTCFLHPLLHVRAGRRNMNDPYTNAAHFLAGKRTGLRRFFSLLCSDRSMMGKKERRESRKLSDQQCSSIFGC